MAPIGTSEVNKQVFALLLGDLLGSLKIIEPFRFGLRGERNREHDYDRNSGCATIRFGSHLQSPLEINGRPREGLLMFNRQKTRKDKVREY
jgi:hypothetical protein